MNDTTTTGIIEHVDPNTLLLETNVRPDQMLNKQFISSIKENGVLEPILARRGADGAIYVRAGARRTMAAIEAGLTSVPVYVTDADDDTAQRLIQQITENDHRLALRQIDRVKGIQMLLDTGLSVTRVAKKLAVSADRVKQSKAVAASQAALNAVATNEVTLAEAAVLAEFEGDDDAVDRLRNLAGKAWFEHEASRMRQAREDRKAYASAKARYEEQGYEVLDSPPRAFDPDYVGMAYINEAVVNPDANPQHWAIIIDEETVFTDKETGEVVEEETIDWNTETDREAAPREGMCHADSVLETTGYVVGEYYCRDLEAAGLTTSGRFAQFSGKGNLGASTGGKGEPTTDDLADKRERRKVIALNKAAEAAQEVRRDFVTKLIARKNPPKGGALFTGRVLASDGYLLANFKADETITDLFGVRHGAKSDISELFQNAGTDARAMVLTLGLVLGALEARTPKSAWRSSGWQFAGPKEYLKFLVEQGYTLSAVEHIVTGDRTADEVYEELTQELTQ